MSRFGLALGVILIAGVIAGAVLISHAPAQLQSDARVPSDIHKAAYAPSRLIVKYKPTVDTRGRRAMAAGYRWHTRHALRSIGYEVVELDDLTVDSALSLLSHDDRIEYAEPDYKVSIAAVPNDTDFSKQWGLHNEGQTGGTPGADISAVEAWDAGAGKPIVVAIIDTGVDDEHPDLQDHIWTNADEIPGNGQDDDGNGYIDDIHGWDFLHDDNDPADDHGHGTHVSGVIAASTNNHIGIAGICWTARVMPLKFLGADGSGYTSDAVRAIEYASAKGVLLSNSSWGGPGYSQALRDAIDSAGKHGMLCMAAAGNTGSNIDAIPQYPAALDLDNIITVAATDAFDSLAVEENWASNYGRRAVDLAAPGVDIHSTISTVPTGGLGPAYGNMSGTSMATPFVTGVAALVWSHVPSLDYHGVRGRLLQSVDLLPTLTNKCATGGRLNAARAIAFEEMDPPGTITDLAVVEEKSSGITLSWTAPGDDGEVGRALAYDLRVSPFPIDAGNFDSAQRVTEVAPPQDPGSPEQTTVNGLDFATTYYFAIKAVDDWYNRGALSNVVTGTTLAPPSLQFSPASIQDSLQAGEHHDHTIYLANLGTGELRYRLRGVYSYDQSNRDDVRSAAPADIGIKDVLLLYADAGATGLRSMLEAYPDIGRVDVWQAGIPDGTIPTVADLQGYDVVVAWNNLVWADLYDIGDALADYIDSGGAVVTLVDCWANKQFSSFGRYFTDPGYSPFVSTGRALFDVRELGSYEATHPIMRGVDSLAISKYYNQVELAPGAYPVAYWDDGTPLVATQHHSVAINVYAGDGYHWFGDFERLMHNAIGYAAGESFWIEAGAMYAELAPLWDTTIAVTLNAANLIAGDYDARIVIESNDPLQPEGNVDVHLKVTGYPTVATEGDSIDVGEAFVGHAAAGSLHLTNAGTDTLVVSSVEESSVEFDVAGGPFQVAPRESYDIPVTFTPPTPGSVSADVVIHSNDPLQPDYLVWLWGHGIEPPQFISSPDQINADLFTGQQFYDTVQIQNTGFSDLHVQIAIKAAPQEPVAGVSGSDGPNSGAASKPASDAVFNSQPVNDASSPAWIPRGVPRAARTSEFTGEIGVLVWRRFVDDSPGGEGENTLAALATYVSNARIDTTSTVDPDSLAALLADKHVFLVPEQENVIGDIMAIGTSWQTVLDDFVRTGGTVIFCGQWGAADGFLTSTGLMTVSAAGQGTNVSVELAQPDHPIAAGVPDPFLGTDATRWYDVSNNDAELIALEATTLKTVVASRQIGLGRVVMLGFDFYSYNDNMARLLGNAVNLSTQAISWLSVDPLMITVPAGSTATAIVHVDPTGVVGGDYLAYAVMNSNDPDRPVVNLPVTLHLVDVPDITVTPDTLDFGARYVGYPRTDTVWIGNDGPAPIAVHALWTDDPRFSPSVASIDVPPDSTYGIGVQFAPDAAGTYTGHLTIESDDPDEPIVEVVLLGIGVAPPVAAVSEDSLLLDLPTGASASQAVELANDGGSDLRYQVQRQLSGSGWYGATSTSMDSNRILLPIAGQWAEHTPMLLPVYDATVVSHPNGRIYVMGGATADIGGRVTTVQVYDPSRDEWTYGTPLPDISYGFGAVVGQDGDIYCFGYIGEATALRYDIDREGWDTLARPLHLPIAKASCAVGPDGRIYIFGGGNNLPMDAVQIYDPSTDSWAAGTEMADTRFGMTAIAGSVGDIYVLGGEYFYGAPAADRTMWIYDTASDSWRDGDSIPTRRHGYGACMGTDGRIYTIGGHTGFYLTDSDYFDLVEIYDPLTRIWTTGPPLTAPVAAVMPVRVGSRIYVIGGYADGVIGACRSLDLMPWLSTTPESGVLVSGQSATIDVSVATSGIPSGSYRTEVTVVSNDPAQPALALPVRISVSSAADIVVMRDTVDFGDAYIGYPVADSVWVHNHGDLLLTLDTLSVEGTGFQLLNAPPSVPVGDSVPLVVECAASAVAPLTGLLRVVSNDPDRPVLELPLVGNGLEAPQLSISPPAFDFDMAVNDSAYTTLTISNPGASQLRWQVSGLQWARGGEVSVQSDSGWTGYSPYPLWSLAGYRIGLQTGTGRDSVFRNDLVRRGAELMDIPYPISAAALDSADVLVMGNSVRYLRAADLDLIRDWLDRGGRMLLAYAGTQIVSDRVRVLLKNTGISPTWVYYAPVTIRNFRPHPLTTGVDSLVPGYYYEPLALEGSARPYVFDSSGHAVVATGTLGNGRIVATSLSPMSPLTRELTANLAFLNRSIDWLLLPDLVQVQPLSGTVQPGETEYLNVSVDGLRRIGYTSDFDLEINSNDPEAAVLSIPATITIHGEPLLATAADTLVFPTQTFVGYDNTDPVRIYNRGTDSLIVSQVISTSTDFEPLETSFTIPVFGSYDLPIRFAPGDTGSVVGTLQFTTNSTTPSVVDIPIRGVGKLAPQVVVPTDTVYMTAESGETKTHTVRIENTGLGELEYGLSFVIHTDALEVSGRATPVHDAGVSTTESEPNQLTGPIDLKPELSGAGSVSTAEAAQWFYYSGDRMQIGVSDNGQVKPIEYPTGFRHLSEYHTVGYTLAFIRSGTDRVVHTGGWTLPQKNLVLISDTELINDDRQAVVEIVGVSADSALEIRRTITFDKHDTWVNIRTKLTNLTTEPLDSLMFKVYADWDVDNAYDSNVWDYDTTRNLVYATQTRAAGTASLRKPTLMDLEARDDWTERLSTVTYPEGPVRFDGMCLHHFELGTLAPGRSQEIVTTMAVGDNRDDLFNVVDRGLYRLNWLWSQNISGTIPAGGFQDIDFLLDARWLYAGQYKAEAVVNSNDPEAPEVHIPFVFQVSGTPVSEIDATHLDFDTVYIGYPESLPITITNSGTADLNVTATSSGVPGLTIEPASLSVPPDQMMTIEVTLTPGDAAILNGAIMLTTDDPASPEVSVPVTGTALWPGTVNLSPDSIAMVIAQGDTQHTAVAITNSGPGVLRWSAPQFGGVLPLALSSEEVGNTELDAASMNTGPRQKKFLAQASTTSGAEAFAEAVATISHLQLTPTSGSVEPDSTQPLDLRVTTSGLPPGTTVVGMQFATSDPATPEVSLPVAVRMFVPQRGDVNINEQINTADIIYLNNALWGRGPDPYGTTGDLNCDRNLTILDVMILVNYVLRSGPPDECD